MIGQIVIAEPKDQSRDPAQYVVVKEWPNALELVPGVPGIRCYKPVRVELDGPRPWLILGRGRCDKLIYSLLKYLREDYKGAAVEWTTQTVDAIQATAEILQQCLMVSKAGLAGTRILAHQPYGNQSGEFIVLTQDDRTLLVVPTDLYALGKTRLISIRDKYAWSITQVSPGVHDLMGLVNQLKGINNTERQRAELTGYLDKMLRAQQ